MPHESFAGTFATLLSASLGIWFVVWAVRGNLDIDRPLSASAWYLRIVVVIMCYSLAAVPSIRPGSRIVVRQTLSAAVGLAFLCWPNFAYYLARGFDGSRATDNWSLTTDNYS